MFKKSLYLLLIALLLLTACQIAPLVLPSANKPKIPVRTIADGPARNTQTSQPQMIHMPSYVTPQTLTEPSEQELQELLPVLEAQSANSGDFQITSQHEPKVHVFQFDSHAKHLQHQIKIPETGSFELILEAGDTAQILDGDASDGSAHLQLPADTFDALFQLLGNRNQNSKLEVNDPLYYVKDSIDPQRGRFFHGHHWLHLGLRPLPVPEDWLSPDGQKLVLKLSTQNLQHFQLYWIARNRQAVFPPGINEIGADGGVIELPGVAKLEIPAGAMPQSEVVVLKQVKSVQSSEKHCYEDLKRKFPGGCISGVKYVTPFVNIHPHALKLKKVAKLELSILYPEQVADLGTAVGITKGIDEDDEDLSFLLFYLQEADPRIGECQVIGVNLLKDS